MNEILNEFVSVKFWIINIILSLVLSVIANFLTDYLKGRINPFEGLSEKQWEHILHGLCAWGVLITLWAHLNRDVFSGLHETYHRMGEAPAFALPFTNAIILGGIGLLYNLYKRKLEENWFYKNAIVYARMAQAGFMFLILTQLVLFVVKPVIEIIFDISLEPYKSFGIKIERFAVILAWLLGGIMGSEEASEGTQEANQEN